MARVDAEGFQEKHARRLKASLEDIRSGVNNVTVNPCEQAAAKQDKMLAGVTRAVQDGKWARALRRVSLDEWKTKMGDKGVNRIPEGIDGAKDKVIEFARELLPHVDAGVAAVKKMPDMTIEDSIARVGTFIRHMSKFKRS